MDCVHNAIAGAREFMYADNGFDSSSRICGGDRAAFVQRYVDLLDAHMSRQETVSYQRFRVANQRVPSNVSGVGSRTSPSVPSCGRTARGGSAVVGGSSSKTSAKRQSQQSTRSTRSLVLLNDVKKNPKKGSTGASS